MLLDRLVSCPYCGETFEVVLDCSAGSHEFVQDCEICCQPIVFLLVVACDGSLERLELRREND